LSHGNGVPRGRQGSAWRRGFSGSPARAGGNGGRYGMKRPFSLVEILTVVVVILIIIGMALGAYSTVSNKMRVTKTKARMKSLEVAISSYRTQYGILPFTNEHGTATDLLVVDQPASFTGPSIHKLLATLGGRNIGLNPRAITFLEVDADGTFRDSWASGEASGFSVALDLNYDGFLSADVIAGDGQLRKEFVIWSKGRDLEDDLADIDAEVNKDNVKSWKE